MKGCIHTLLLVIELTPNANHLFIYIYWMIVSRATVFCTTLYRWWNCQKICANVFTPRLRCETNSTVGTKSWRENPQITVHFYFISTTFPSALYWLLSSSFLTHYLLTHLFIIPYLLPVPFTHSIGGKYNAPSDFAVPKNCHL